MRRSPTLRIVRGGGGTDQSASPDPAAVEMRRALREAGGDQAEQAAAAGCSVRTLRRYRRGEGLGALRVWLRLKAMGRGRKAA